MLDKIRNMRLSYKNHIKTLFSRKVQNVPGQLEQSARLLSNSQFSMPQALSSQDAETSILSRCEMVMLETCETGGATCSMAIDPVPWP